MNTRTLVSINVNINPLSSIFMKNVTNVRTVSLALLFALMALLPLSLNAQQKREFRGAWIQCVNGQFQGLSTAAMQKALTTHLDSLQHDGANAVIFQVRPECDALYDSRYEPWSRFLTGVQGRAPQPYWDPLQWMVEQCHKRGMELHAWINPYRAKTKGTTTLAQSHIAMTQPDRVFKYDGQYILNPGIDENREYICRIVGDIVRRYDIDGLHMDDYFYPYPAAGETIPDQGLFAQKSNGISNLGDWRRYHVNIFVKQLHDTIVSIKPWVKFGVSPFGIYRNKKNASNGSDTKGLQNYDDLYADVLLWVNNGWVDYCVPQLYWQIGHPTADYKTLIKWWNQHASNRPLYIGEDVERTVKNADPDNPKLNQMPAKFALHNSLPNIDGTVLWYSKTIVDDIGRYGTMLRKVYWKYPALQPSMTFIDKKAPKKVKRLKAVWTSDGYILFWTAPKGNNWRDEAVKYVVYRFAKGEVLNTNDPSKIVCITGDTFCKLPYDSGRQHYTYVVTALNRLQNESKSAKKNVKM